MVGPGVQDNIVNLLNEVMDYESNNALPNMDDHVFNDEYEEDDTDEDEADMGNEVPNLSLRPCLLALTKIGWQELEKVKVREVCQHATDHSKQKRDTMKYIMSQVMKMKSSMRDVSVCKKNPTAECLQWSQYLNYIQPNYHY